MFRKPIAHGLLIQAMGSGLGLAFPSMRTLAFLAIKEWKFLEPVYIGDTIRVKAKLLEKEERSRGRRYLWKVTARTASTSPTAAAR